MTTLMGGQNSQCAVETVACVSAGWRLNTDLVNRKSNSRSNEVHQLGLRIQKTVPRWHKIMGLGHEASDDFMSKPIWWFERANQQSRQAAGSKCPGNREFRSYSDGC